MIFEHEITTHKRQEMIDITRAVAGDITSGKLENGLCVVFITHTTAAVTVNENADPDVTGDMLKKFRQLVPEGDGYRHLEGNSDAHILSTFIGCSLSLPVVSGKMVLGIWQGIYFVELDGPRQRHFKVKLLTG